ncbi:hypothetical protein AB0K05_24845 [Nonomuraea sp. NPDC049486]|uniref:hypothetical protein n=1 Tax=Nonomuraea sp. NPDC049486 TaxID=3155773 RepID=UPI00344907ED
MKRIILSIPDRPGFEAVEDLDGQFIDVAVEGEGSEGRTVKINGRTLKLRYDSNELVGADSYERWRAWSVSG